MLKIKKEKQEKKETGLIGLPALEEETKKQEVKREDEKADEKNQENIKVKEEPEKKEKKEKKSKKIKFLPLEELLKSYGEDRKIPLPEKLTEEVKKNYEEAIKLVFHIEQIYGPLNPKTPEQLDELALNNDSNLKNRLSRRISSKLFTGSGGLGSMKINRDSWRSSIRSASQIFTTTTSQPEQTIDEEIPESGPIKKEEKQQEQDLKNEEKKEPSLKDNCSATLFHSLLVDKLAKIANLQKKQIKTPLFIELVTKYNYYCSKLEYLKDYIPGVEHKISELTINEEALLKKKQPNSEITRVLTIFTAFVVTLSKTERLQPLKEIVQINRRKQNPNDYVHTADEVPPAVTDFYQLTNSVQASNFFEEEERKAKEKAENEQKSAILLEKLGFRPGIDQKQSVYSTSNPVPLNGDLTEELKDLLKNLEMGKGDEVVKQLEEEKKEKSQPLQQQPMQAGSTPNHTSWQVLANKGLTRRNLINTRPRSVMDEFAQDSPPPLTDYCQPQNTNAEATVISTLTSGPRTSMDMTQKRNSYKQEAMAEKEDREKG